MRLYSIGEQGFVLPAKDGNPGAFYALMQARVYILACARNGTVYTGVTSDLVKAVWEHKGDLVEGFTKRCAVRTFVWFELVAFLCPLKAGRRRQANLSGQLDIDDPCIGFELTHEYFDYFGLVGSHIARLCVCILMIAATLK